MWQGWDTCDILPLWMVIISEICKKKSFRFHRFQAVEAEKCFVCCSPLVYDSLLDIPRPTTPEVSVSCLLDGLRGPQGEHHAWAIKGRPLHRNRRDTSANAAHILRKSNASAPNECNLHRVT